MNIRGQKLDKADTLVHPPVSHASLLQRKCACGGAAGFGNSCSSCRSTELARPQSHGLRPSDRQVEIDGFSQGPGNGRGLVAQTGTASGHDFGRLQVAPPTSAGKMSMHV